MTGGPYLSVACARDAGYGNWLGRGCGNGLSAGEGEWAGLAAGPGWDFLFSFPLSLLFSFSNYTQI